MTDATERTAANTRDDLLDQGYNALRGEEWDRAALIFDGLLQEDPSCGLSCLGKVMAEKQICSREELAENWETIQQDPDFQTAMQPAKEDFKQWLREDMKKQTETAESSGPDLMESSWILPSFADLDTGRQLLLIFAAVEVLMYFFVTFLMTKTDYNTTESFGTVLTGSLIFAAMICGLTVILGPVYGNSILNVGTFCSLLRILNNIVGIIGCTLCVCMALAFYDAYKGQMPVKTENLYFCAAFAVAAMMHLISLVVPPAIEKVEYG